LGIYFGEPEAKGLLLLGIAHNSNKIGDGPIKDAHHQKKKKLS
jgi:hypothetical protein